MKIASDGYIAAQEADYRRPAELFHIWWGDREDGGQHWRYTSGDVAVVHGGNTYTPATIDRDTVEYNSKLEVSTLQIKVARVQQPVVDFIALNPLEILWVAVFDLIRDQPDPEAGVIFVGQIKNVSIKGLQAIANCEGLESFLKQPVPVPRYQPACNNSLYDDKCMLTDTDWAEAAAVTAISSDGMTVTLSGAGFEAKADDYYTRGYLVYGESRRMIVDHIKASKVVLLRYAISSLVVGAAVTVFAGCDLDIATCQSKFNNMKNFYAHPYIPLDNPCAKIP